MTTGGFGFLTRAYGLSFDNIVELELVTADGIVHVLNESSTARGGVEAGESRGSSAFARGH